MFRDSWRVGAARFALSMSCAALLSAGAVTAETGFGGSFDAAPAPTPPVTQPPPAQSAGGFGGSFDGGGTPAPAPSPGPDDGFDTQFDSPQPSPPPQSEPTVDQQIQAFEGRDYGVQPTGQLRSGQMHAPTPTSLPGASVVSTQGLSEALNSGLELVLIDVLGSDYSLPDAVMAPALSSSGHFRDRLQQQAGKWLRQVTRGETDMPIVLYCSDPMCWLSYNAALRTVAAGYTNVYWYRGGLQAWQMAGLRLVPAAF